MTTTGTVYLVGAGPGDPGLVTLRAAELVASADVLVYDRLIPRSLVATAPADCERIDAGKTAGDHTLGQDAINELLVDRARRGKRVVRLKGGDPFVFGRGGEEAAACREAGVPFEVTPGVTSAFAAAGCAGVPVTHRGVSTHVTVVTASAGPDGTGDPDYDWLAASTGTVVLLMGLRRLRHVCERMVSAGAPANRPVAVVSRGTTAGQRTRAGTLADIADVVAAAPLASPAIIVVGDVVDLRPTLDWFEQRQLFGCSVAVTRARAQASKLVARLEQLGATVVECPTIRTQPVNADVLADAIREIGRYDVVTFTSATGAELALTALQASGRDVRALAGTKIAVVGQATADACRLRGIEPDVSAPTGEVTSIGLLRQLARESLLGARVLCVRAEVADERFVEGLAERGAHVRVVHAYRTVIDVPDADVVKAALAADLVTFSSASTVDNFALLAPEGVRRPPAVVIGPVTADAATAHGFDVVGQATHPGVDGLVDAVLAHLIPGPTTISTASQEN
jgi:uroporphyrinogen III methyltransferase/synthase